MFSQTASDKVKHCCGFRPRVVVSLSLIFHLMCVLLIHAGRERGGIQSLKRCKIPLSAACLCGCLLLHALICSSFANDVGLSLLHECQKRAISRCSASSSTDIAIVLLIDNGLGKPVQSCRGCSTVSCTGCGCKTERSHTSVSTASTISATIHLGRAACAINWHRSPASVTNGL